jgi:hypothetical protein
VFPGIRGNEETLTNRTAIQEERAMKKTTKEIRKDKKLWADPMSYPVFAK